MNLSVNRKQTQAMVAIIIGLLGMIAFIYETKIAMNPFVIYLISLFLLFPYRKESELIRRLIFLISALFIGWMLSNLGMAVLPFAVSFIIAYLLDPAVEFLQKKGIPRWVSALIVILIALGGVTVIAVFVFPLIFSQLDSAIVSFKKILASATEFIDSNEFEKTLLKFGINDETLAEIKAALLPKLETFLSTIFGELLTFLTNISLLATQIINVILIPILSFYFLADFHKIKKLIIDILSQKNKKMLNDIVRINRFFKIYILWQITAAFIVATICTLSFYIFNVPYPVMLGLICGMLNPIPYIGSLINLVICSLTVLIVSDGSLTKEIIVIFATINGVHFINAYLLEPNIAGKQVGVHPLLLIASLFVFSYLFGFIGLFIAVPSTAGLVMFFNDWRQKSILNNPQINKENNEISEAES